MIVLGLALVAVSQALPMPQQAPAGEPVAAPEELRPKRQNLPLRLAEARDDSYGQPAYAPAPYKPPHKGYGGPVYVKTFVKTDYDGNFKWGVKHNIDH